MTDGCWWQLDELVAIIPPILRRNATSISCQLKSDCIVSHLSIDHVQCTNIDLLVPPTNAATTNCSSVDRVCTCAPLRFGDGCLQRPVYYYVVLLAQCIAVLFYLTTLVKIAKMDSNTRSVSSTPVSAMKSPKAPLKSSVSRYSFFRMPTMHRNSIIKSRLAASRFPDKRKIKIKIHLIIATITFMVWDVYYIVGRNHAALAGAIICAGMYGTSMSILFMVNHLLNLFPPPREQNKLKFKRFISVVRRSQSTMTAVMCMSICGAALFVAARFAFSQDIANLFISGMFVLICIVVAFLLRFAVNRLKQELARVYPMERSEDRTTSGTMESQIKENVEAIQKYCSTTSRYLVVSIPFFFLTGISKRDSDSSLVMFYMASMACRLIFTYLFRCVIDTLTRKRLKNKKQQSTDVESSVGTLGS